ncbi:MAG: hypothetical protein WC789_11155 [Lentisphaeria bacterium]|jgi:V/A-type H+-transporting ATPase subunit E
MADDLQGLLERIHSEGVAKAQAEREALLAQAQAEAARIHKEAEAAAAAMVAKAKQEAEMLVGKGREALRQAARDTLLTFRGQLQDRLKQVVKAATGQALAPERLAGILAEVVKGYLAQAGGAVELQVSPAVGQELAAGFFGALGADLKKTVELKPVPGVAGGFKLAVHGTDVVYDFTDAALAEALSQFLNPKLADLLKQETAG